GSWKRSGAEATCAARAPWRAITSPIIPRGRMRSSRAGCKTGTRTWAKSRRPYHEPELASHACLDWTEHDASSALGVRARVARADCARVADAYTRADAAPARDPARAHEWR